MLIIVRSRKFSSTVLDTLSKKTRDELVKTNLKDIKPKLGYQKATLKISSLSNFMIPVF